MLPINGAEFHQESIDAISHSPAMSYDAWQRCNFFYQSEDEKLFKTNSQTDKFANFDRINILTGPEEFCNVGLKHKDLFQNCKIFKGIF